MSTICFVSSKGGTGKTTAALLLALGMENLGLRVSMIDCDPNLPLFSWRRLTPNSSINVFPATTAEELKDILPLANTRSNFVIVDTEGSVRGRRMVQDIQADLAVIPVGPSALEAVEAIRTSEFLRTVPGRRDPFLPHGCLLTRTPAALKPRSLAQVISRIKEQNISLFETAVIEKEAYRQLFAAGGGLGAEGSGLEAARVNAAHYSACILSLFGKRQPAAQPPQPPPQPVVQNQQQRVAEQTPQWVNRPAAIDIRELAALLPKGAA